MNLTLAYRVFVLFATLFFLNGCQSINASSNLAHPNTLTQSYQCKNDIEVQCNASGCSANTMSFTPMSVDVDASGELNVCAYSGCWNGQADVYRADQFVVLTGLNMNFSTSTETQDIALTIDALDGVAVLKLGEFAQPLLCKATTN